ncbi:MAG: ATP-binding protein [Leptospiraceae bacterium]|nr:ATP-binding protein [Leptospiraceae bacterium]
MKNIRNKIKVNHLGPIQEGEVEFGELTVLVGPQASGKSIFLTVDKLYNDMEHIKTSIEGNERREFKRKKEDYEEFLNLFLGDGSNEILTRADIKYNSKQLDFEKLFGKNYKKNTSQNSVTKHFYIPAQRVLTMQAGWPSLYPYLSPELPFTIKDFSDFIARELIKASNKRELLHTQIVQYVLNRNIYPNLKMEIIENVKPQLSLSSQEENLHIPYTAWSAGQKEISPLILGLYYLLPRAKISRRDSEYVTIEEPEMGLHPTAIIDIFFLILYLLTRGYKVRVSTHSVTIIELLWAVQSIKEVSKEKKTKALDSLISLFFSKEEIRNIRNFNTYLKSFPDLLEKTYKAYYFKREENGKTIIHDISSLDPIHEKEEIANWGGIGRYSEKIAGIVGDLYE